MHRVSLPGSVSVEGDWEMVVIAGTSGGFMQARTAIEPTARRAGRTAFGLGLMTILAAVALSACTPSGTTTTTGSPSASLSSGSATATPTSTPTASSTASATSTATPTTTASASSSPTLSASPTPSPTPAESTSYPSTAPQTGGGGTAGFQDVGLLVLGGGAIAAGFASIAYRRKLTRRR
jgi:hypothetical protein